MRAEKDGLNEHGFIVHIYTLPQSHELCSLTSVYISNAEKHVHREILAISTVGLEGNRSSECGKLATRMDRMNGKAYGIWMLAAAWSQSGWETWFCMGKTSGLPRFNMT